MSLTAVPIESSFVLTRARCSLTVIGLLATLRRATSAAETLVFSSSFLVVAAFGQHARHPERGLTPRRARVGDHAAARSSALASCCG